MLRIIQNTSAAGAKNYYTSASMADYYTEGQELAGVWRGKGAARFGLSGAVEKDAWDALCDNREPTTGESLTPRRKQERRVGYDFNFHVPKSVSLLYGLTHDDRILDAFRASVNETMRDMESEVKTRVRKSGKNEDRISGNMVWGEFVHTTARPVNGVPDPHLHAHCFVFNVTFDDKEQRFKAAQFGDIKKDASYFEAKFHSRMARKLAELGLPIERTRKGWEIGGISRASLDKFSRRTVHIEETAKQKGIRGAAEKSELGAKTRERKQKHLSMDELRKEWRTRLSDDERSGLAQIAMRVGGSPIPESYRRTKEAALLATEHCFERKSVVAERELLTQALKRSVGLAVAQAAEQAVRDQHLIVAERDGQRLVTTSVVLAEEQAMLNFAREGRGACPPLQTGAHPFEDTRLNEGQRRAVINILHSHDRVMVVRGAAGAGKTTLLREAVRAIQNGGKKVFAFAPSADASRIVLRNEGFPDADTVARLLVDEKLQEQIRGQVVLIDESGLIGTRTMNRIFSVADHAQARVILVGDKRQHGSVERGAALRLLETEASIVPSQVTEIQRQSSDYRDAVKALSQGRVESAMRQLDKLGWVKELPDDVRYQAMAKEYVQTTGRGYSALVVSPTHAEGRLVTQAIRTELRKARRIDQVEREFQVLEDARLTTAEQRDAVSYESGQTLIYHQNARGRHKGDRLIVGETPIPLDQADRFNTFRSKTIPLSKGDLIRITHNGATADGHRLENGSVYAVEGFSGAGDIQLSNGWRINKDWGHWRHAYASTSHSSQGKSVDVAIVAQSSMSHGAASMEQAYVSISRGKKWASIYTDDKQALLNSVARSDPRVSATELVNGHHERAVTIERLQQFTQPPQQQPTSTRGREAIIHER